MSLPLAVKCIPEDLGGTCSGLLKVVSNPNVIDMAYLVAIIFFVVGLRKLTSPTTARQGNQIAAIGMLIAVIVTLLDRHIISYEWILLGGVLGAPIGYFSAKKV